MPALTGLAIVAAALLALAGAQKLLDPTMTVGALRGLGLPSSPTLVRVGSLVEVALGVAALALGGAALWWGVASSYVAFGVFVVMAMRRGTMIGSCGCFGREDTPPHWTHVALNTCLAALAVAVAVADLGAPLAAVADDPGAGIVVLLLAAVALQLLYVAYVELPRALVSR